MLGKVIIKGIIHCKTGLHIGASKEQLEIGAIDSPVVRDPLTREPYIPGSSLKGKLRSLLEKLFLENEIEVENKKYKITLNRKHKSGGVIIRRHECGDWEPYKEEKENSKDEYPGAQYCPICRLFGSVKSSTTKTKNDKEPQNWPARLIVRDAFMTKESKEKLENIETGLLYAEWKWENSLDRVTASANPRQLERVPRGTEFEMELVYTVENVKQMEDDLQNLKKALELLEMDYLGGHGSRGYGQVKIQNLEITVKKFKDGKIEELPIDKPQRFEVKNLEEVITELCRKFKNSEG